MAGRPVGEPGMHPVQPFRAMNPPKLRLKGRESGPVRSSALVWQLLRHGGRKGSWSFLVR